MSPRIKICGLCRPEDMRAAVEAGAHYLGLVFAASSPRTVSVDDVADWLGDARGECETVGVFRDQPAGEVEEIALRLDLDLVQLHGGEEGPTWRRLPVRMIEAQVIEPGMDALPAPRLEGVAWARLLDSGAGSGRVFDWSLAEGAARAERLFLAGGLDPENVEEAIRRVVPFAVDVSSGVESSPGRKDPQKIQRFVEAVRRASDDEL